MPKMLAAVMLAWVLGLYVVWAASGEYRLSGIVRLDGGERLAVIQRPQGNHQIYRADDEVDGNRLLEIGDRWVRIRFPDGEHRLFLSGGEAIETSPGPEVSVPTVSSVEVTPELVSRLDDVASPRDRAGDANTARRALNATLGLPANARLVAVDHEPVGPTEQMTERLAGMLGEGRVPMKLEFEDAAGRRTEFYLSATQQAEVAGGAELQNPMQ